MIRSHGASALVRDLARLGVQVHQSTPQRWADRDSIPGEYWKAISDLGIASLADLAAAAARGRSAKTEPRGADA